MGNKPVYIYVTPFFPSPGNWRGVYCLDAVKALMRDGRYDVVVFKPGEDGDYEYQGVKVWTFKTRQLPSAIFPFLFRRQNQRSFLKALDRAGIDCQDVAVCHGHTAPFSVYPLVVKSLNPRCLTLLHHHDLQSFGLNNGILRHCWLYRLIEFPILRRWHERMDCHVFISELVKKSFLSAPDARWTDYRDYSGQMRGLFYRPVRIRHSIVSVNGVDGSVFRGEKRPCSDATRTSRPRHVYLTIGCIGNFVELKDHLTLLKAVERLSHIQIKLKFVGSGPLRTYCEQFVADHGLVVEFLNEVPHEQLADFYRSIDLFVLPSYFEGFGCVYAESWMCGTPFITTTGSGIVDMIPEGERNLWVCEPHNEEILARMIEHYFRTRPRQHLTQNIEINSVVKRFLDEVEQLRGRV